MSTAAQEGEQGSRAVRRAGRAKKKKEQRERRTEQDVETPSRHVILAPLPARTGVVLLVSG